MMVRLRRQTEQPCPANPGPDESAGVGTAINISGLLLHVHPDRAEAVRAHLLQMPGIEVHAMSPEGRLVVTLENASDREMADTFARVQALPHVLSASLIYHHSEDNREIPPPAQEH